MKLELVAAQPPAVLTAILPLLAPAGTTAVVDVPEPFQKTVAALPPKVTANTAFKFDPVTVTVVPTAPEPGLNP
jgi:hypothetical protein